MSLAPLLAGGTGCTQDFWEAGTWIEEDFAIRDDDACDWASGIIAPDEAHHYTLGDTIEFVGESDTGDASDTLANAQSWIQNHADNFWEYCSLEFYYGYGESLEFDCPAAIQLVQPDLGLDAYFTKLCGSTEDTWIRSWTNGLLVREGEAFMNHYIELSCRDESGDGDTGEVEESDNDSYCSMSYSSWLKKQ